jgi:signal transduction histidine kinase
MNGTIIAANRTDGRGAVFTIRLPVASEPQRLDAAA